MQNASNILNSLNAVGAHPVTMSMFEANPWQSVLNSAGWNAKGKKIGKSKGKGKGNNSGAVSGRCASSQHAGANCPHKDNICGNCGITGHIKAVCSRAPDQGAAKKAELAKAQGMPATAPAQAKGTLGGTAPAARPVLDTSGWVCVKCFETHTSESMTKRRKCNTQTSEGCGTRRSFHASPKQTSGHLSLAGEYYGSHGRATESSGRDCGSGGEHSGIEASGHNGPTQGTGSTPQNPKRDTPSGG